VVRCFFQNNRTKIGGGSTFLGTAPTTEHCMLGDWLPSFASSKIWGLHRLPSTVCLGTGRPDSQLGDLGTAPTTEHCMLGDWSPSPPARGSGSRTNHRALYARGLVDQPTRLEELRNMPLIKALSARGLDNFNFLDLATRFILRLPASSGTTSVRCIRRCILVLEFL